SHFQSVGSVKAAATGSSKKDYSFTDRTAAASKLHYRIRSTDIGGKKGYSNIAIALDAELSAALSTYPNPVNVPQLNVKLSGAAAGEYKLVLTNANGQSLYSSSFTVRSTGQTMTIPVSQLANGRYVVTVKGADGRLLTQSIIINK
ncbi:MAG: T9SS type A sorting domain-containing protein, partial [Sphingobacteriales bacterium]